MSTDQPIIFQAFIEKPGGGVKSFDFLVETKEVTKGLFLVAAKGYGCRSEAEDYAREMMINSGLTINWISRKPK